MLKYGKMDTVKTHIKKYWEKGWISFIICFLCLLSLLKFTWLKWGDLIVDVGREMYVPFELSLGKSLYRDVFYIYGPFSPYFNSLLFRVFGVHLHSLYLSGIITLCAASVLIYKISRFFLDVFFSTFTVLTFLIVFAFGHYTYLGNYNFILPYSYSSIHAITFSLAALYFFHIWILKKSNRNACLSSLFMLLTILSRIDVGIMLISSILVGAIFYVISFRRDENSMRLAAPKLGLCIAIPFIFSALIYILFLKSSVVQESSLFDIWIKSSDVRDAFAGWLSGIDDLPQNLSIIFKTILYYLAFCILFGVGGFIIGHLYIRGLKTSFFGSTNSPFLEPSRVPSRDRVRMRSGRSVLKIIFSLFVALFLISASFLFYRKFFISYDFQYRSLPIICISTIFISAIATIRKKEREKNLFILMISLFSLLMMARMLLHVWAGHYGFYILVPAIIIYHLLFLNIVAGILDLDIAKRFFRFGFLFIFTLFIISHFKISNLCYSQRTLKLSSRRGEMYVFNSDREYRLGELMKFLDIYIDKDDTLVIFPEGVVINFLLERENPLYYYSYHPVDLAKQGVENEVIRDMEDKKVDYVVLTQRRTDQYGYPVFRVDYGRKIFDYIVENYVLYKQFGPFPFTTERYGIALFKRK